MKDPVGCRAFVWDTLGCCAQDGGRKAAHKRRHDEIALVEDPHAGLDPASAALEKEREVRVGLLARPIQAQYG
jgi:hypothetical protein